MKKAAKYQIKSFIDPHQDCWSRWTGGSGAPAWTLTLAGLNIKTLHSSGAALVQNLTPPQDFQRMIWPTNYWKLASATMFTLFWAGKDFAPQAIIKNEDYLKSYVENIHDKIYISESDSSVTQESTGSSQTNFDSIRTPIHIQDYLQHHFIHCFAYLAQRIQQSSEDVHTHVLGFDTLNEPHPGFLQLHDIREISHEQELKLGAVPTALDGMILGSGGSLEMNVWQFGSFGPYKSKRKITVNPNHDCVWLSERKCIWAQEGVWDPVTGQALLPHYFSSHPITGKKVDWMTDYWRPFVLDFSRKLRCIDKEAILFIEPPVNEIPISVDNIPAVHDKGEQIVYSPHWYDGITLMKEKFSRWNIDYLGWKRGHYWFICQALSFGRKNIEKNFVKQLKTIKNEGLRHLGNYPCLIGEIGVPLGLQKQNEKDRTLSLHTSLNAIDENALHCTIWNYSIHNDSVHGDQWNDEDLSGKIYFKFFFQSFHLVIIGIIVWSSAKHTFEISPSFKSQHQIDLPLKEKDHLFSDQFNPEKASPIFQPNCVVEGTRAISAVMRPYPILTSGIPIRWKFSLDSCQKTFQYIFESEQFDHPGDIYPLKTIIWLPSYHYGEEKDILDPLKTDIWLSQGHWSYDSKTQYLEWIIHQTDIPKHKKNHSYFHQIIIQLHPTHTLPLSLWSSPVRWIQHLQKWLQS